MQPCGTWLHGFSDLLTASLSNCVATALLERQGIFLQKNIQNTGSVISDKERVNRKHTACSSSSRISNHRLEIGKSPAKSFSLMVSRKKKRPTTALRVLPVHTATTFPLSHQHENGSGALGRRTQVYCLTQTPTEADAQETRTTAGCNIPTKS